MDKRDYFRFIHDLFEFNDIANVDSNNTRHFQLLDTQCPVIGRNHSRKLLVQLHAFCLMPNHFHLLLSPLTENATSIFMHKLSMGYSKYFNERYNRSGSLWQGKYKSVPIKNDRQFQWIPYYIHFNPLDLVMPEWRERGIKNPKKAESFLKTYRWSSHLDYLGIKNFPSLTQRDYYLQYFEGEKGYANSIPDMLRSFSVKNGEKIMLE